MCSDNINSINNPALILLFEICLWGEKASIEKHDTQRNTNIVKLDSMNYICRLVKL